MGESAKARRLRGKAKKGRQFLRLFTNVKRSTEYHGLGCYARALLFELIDRFNGCNNGMIGLGVREAAYELGCSQGTACNAMRELDDSGLARPLTPGAWRGKKASEWCLTFLYCNKTGQAPRTQYEERIPHSEFTTRSAKVHVVEHREPLSSRGGAQKRNSSINDSDLSSRGDAHIDSTRGRGESECAEAGSNASRSSLMQRGTCQACDGKGCLTCRPRDHGIGDNDPFESLRNPNA